MKMTRACSVVGPPPSRSLHELHPRPTHRTYMECTRRLSYLKYAGHYDSTVYIYTLSPPLYAFRLRALV